MIGLLVGLLPLLRLSVAIRNCRAAADEGKGAEEDKLKGKKSNCKKIWSYKEEQTLMRKEEIKAIICFHLLPETSETTATAELSILFH